MPKSKRNQQVSLTKTDKKGREAKVSLYNQVQECVEKYTHIHVFKVENMRNSFMKEVRTHFKDSKFFYGSNRVMAKALGMTEEEEVSKNTSFIAKALVGDVGLLFTNESTETIAEYFESLSEQDFARGGGVATDTFIVPKGEVVKDGLPFPNNMEPLLRKLGLPTELSNGKMLCRQDYTVCTPGQVLTSDQAHLLKQFGVQMAFFKVKIVCSLSSGIFYEHEK